MVYSFILNIRTNTVFNLLPYSQETYAYFKDQVLTMVKSIYDSSFSKLGSYGRKVQIDEMAFKRGQLIRNPTSEDDSEIMWIIGAVEEQTEEEILRNERQKFFLLTIPNRRSVTIKHVLYDHILEGTYIKSDGYPSYPPAIFPYNNEFNSNYEHEIVNHTLGFVNLHGTHTNTIEGFWLHLRDFWRERDGVSRLKLEDFLTEFRFLKYYVNRKKKDTVENAFILLLQAIFTDSTRIQ